ncbi:MAG: histidine--tRNA ligase [Actinobacteria bacterium]|uniref:Histidine--tRNA ligase n=2 Tax=root TaxID=1 RepID=A0ABU8E563_9ACTN|nr:histidine--tRNA ligase [Klenkia terrae]MSW65438.1 histidine--tRNA ligase [Actinomycetota bacterium]
MSDLVAPKGTFDVLPPDSARFLAVRETLTAPLRRAGYGYVETPVFEDTAVFARGVGESTDVVSKEMYTFTDKGGRSLTLRPELTAGLMRSFIEHRLYSGPLPVKLWSVGSAFRYERPQAGRYRHFTQVDVEALGIDDPALDAEVVALADQGYRDLGLTGYELQLTSLGDSTCRPQYRELLTAFLAKLDLDEDTRRRAGINPLRVLDDKRPEVQAQLVDAPLMVDHLSDATKAHYDAVRQHLADLGVAWVEAPRLVRGLDYYTKTTFEFVHGGLGSQSGIGGGGRYDGLSAALGGPDVSGIGYAVGVDRTILAVQAEGLDIAVESGVQAFVVPLGAEAKKLAVRWVGQLRAAGVSADTVYGDRGLKGAMKAADRSGAAQVVVVGDRDLADGVAQLKTMATGEQVAVPLGELVDRVRATVGA